MKLSIKIIVLSFLFLMPSLTPTSFQAQIPLIPEYDIKVYLGYEYGAAGIVDSLIFTLKSNILNNDESTTILDMSQKGLEGIWDNRAEFSEAQLSTWAKTPTDSLIYPGHKYGATGILSVYLQMYNVTQDPLWLERAEKSFWLLANQAINSTHLPHWPYAFYLPKADSGIALTGIKFGSIGILQLCLQLYEITQNISYLNQADLIVAWLETISNEINLNNSIYQIIPWYAAQENETLVIKLDYGSGLAGIAPILYRYGTAVNSIKHQNWALSLGNFLIKTQHDDGSWTIEYTNINTKSGFDQGTAGVLYGLNQLKSLNNTRQYDQALIAGINWIYSNYIQNDSLFGFYEDSYNKKIFNGLSRGSLGVMKSLSSLTSFLSQDQLEIISEYFEWVIINQSVKINQDSTDLLILQYSPSNFEFIDFSYSDGLAGLLNVLLEIYNINNMNSELQFDIKQAISDIIHSFYYYQQPDGLWSKQIKFSQEWTVDRYQLKSNQLSLNFFEFSILLITIFYLIKKIK